MLARAKVMVNCAGPLVLEPSGNTPLSLLDPSAPIVRDPPLAVTSVPNVNGRSALAVNEAGVAANAQGATSASMAVNRPTPV